MRRSRAIWDSISESLRFANIFQRVPGGVDAGNPVTKVRVSAIVNPASRATCKSRSRPTISVPYRRC